MDDFVKEIMLLAAKHDMQEDLYWNEDFRFFIPCNDFFAWGVADMEEVTEEDLPALRQAVEDADDGYGGFWGGLLYCARKAGMRPQGAYYMHIPEEHWPLFDACGPERATGIGNPVPYPNRYFAIVSESGVLGATRESEMWNVIREEPQVTFVEITKEEFGMEPDEEGSIYE